MHHFGSDSTTIGCLAVKFCNNIHDPQRMNSDNFDDPLSFQPAPPAGQNIYSSSKISHHGANKSALKFAFMVPRGSPNDIKVPDFFFWFVFISMRLTFVVQSEMYQTLLDGDFHTSFMNCFNFP